MVCLCWVAGARHSSFFDVFFVIGALLGLTIAHPERAKLTYLIKSYYSPMNIHGFHPDHHQSPTCHGTTIVVSAASSQ